MCTTRSPTQRSSRRADRDLYDWTADHHKDEREIELHQMASLVRSLYKIADSWLPSSFLAFIAPVIRTLHVLHSTLKKIRYSLLSPIDISKIVE